MLNSNINKMYAYIFWGSLLFDRSLWMIYLTQGGMTLLQVSILQSMLNIAMFLFEFPSGIIADKFGKKKAISIGQILIIVYLLTMVLSDFNFYILAVGFIIYGIGLSLISGADQALIYDSLGKDSTSLYQKIIGKYNAITIFSLAVSTLLGGFIQKISWELVFLLGVASQLIAILTLAFVKESAVENSNKTNPEFNIGKEIKDFIKTKLSFKLLIITIALLQSVLSVIYMFGQVLFIEVGFSVTGISTIFAILAVLSAFASIYSYKLVNKFTENKLIKWCLSLSLVVFLSMAFSDKFVLLGLFILINILFEVWDTTFNAVLHHTIPSNIRSSLVSLVNLLCSLFMVFLSLGFGILEKYTSILNIVSVTGVVAIVASLILFLIYTKRTKEGSITAKDTAV